MKVPQRDLTRAAGFAFAGPLLLAAVGAATVPIVGKLPMVEQGLVFGLMIALYLSDGGYRERQKRPLLRVAIGVLTIFLTLRYLNWRLSDTLPFGFGAVNIALGVVLVLAELHGIISAIAGQVINILPLDRATPAIRGGEAAYPSVDILIPTYNEDPIVVETTVVAATQLHYPTGKCRVYILDDGGTDAKLAKAGDAGKAARQRAEALKKIAATFGAIYLTRTKNARAKAGNINEALPRIHGELILILDCDHVPTDDFLERTVGFFRADPKLFLLQTPHNFVTPDPIERNLGTFLSMPAENELFYSVMQPGLDFWGAAFFCGSAALLRRSVLDEIGGISGKSITEDAETTVKAMRKGYRTAFYNRSMVSGLQPETFAGFIVQRLRWAQGMLQIFMLDNVWMRSGLTIMQRVLFTNFAFYWLFPVSRAILLAMPPLFLLFGFNVAVTTPEKLLLYAVPYYLAAILNAQYFYGRVRWPFVSQVYETAQTVFLLAGIASVLRHPRAPTFKVTPKGEVLNRDFVSRLSWPFYCLLALALVSLAVGVSRMIDEPQLRWALVFVSFWVLLDVLALLGVIGALAERRQRRLVPRVVRRLPVWIRMGNGPEEEARTANLSSHGAGLSLPPTGSVPRVGGPIELRFPGSGVRLGGEIRHVTERNGLRTMGVQYRPRSAVEVRVAVAAAFGSSAALAEWASTRHRGVNVLYALFYLAKIGGAGAARHFRISLLAGVHRLRLSRQTRRLVAAATAKQDTIPLHAAEHAAGVERP